uniref:Uncharacterized protein n=1 Tax=viral metagenome TaxID=1070528 RepID=A0A6M3KW87_9ZZZZ
MMLSDRIADHITAGMAAGFGNHCVADAIIAEFVQWGDSNCDHGSHTVKRRCNVCWDIIRREAK